MTTQDARPPESIMPGEAAALLLAWLEKRGAIVRLEDGYVRADLNGIRDMTAAKADALSHAILGLRDELRAILRARRTLH